MITDCANSVTDEFRYCGVLYQLRVGEIRSVGNIGG